MPNLVKFGKGVASDEQDLIAQFKNFVVGICGWEFIEAVSDTASDRDYVFKSPGKAPGYYHDLYMRWRGNGNFVHNYMYTRWGSSIDYDGELYSTDYTYTPCYNTSFNWWAFGDEDGCWLVWQSGNSGTGTSYFSAYTGYMNTYYPNDIDYRPIAAIGQRYDYRWFDENRVLMASIMQDMFHTGTSGGGHGYLSSKDLYNYTLAYHDPSDRDGSWGHVPIVVYRPWDNHKLDLRGELLHCVQLPGNGLSSEDWVSISGTNYKYFVSNYANDETNGFGPVDTASGTTW